MSQSNSKIIELVKKTITNFENELDKITQDPVEKNNYVATLALVTEKLHNKSNMEARADIMANFDFIAFIDEDCV